MVTVELVCGGCWVWGRRWPATRSSCRTPRSRSESTRHSRPLNQPTTNSSEPSLGSREVLLCELWSLTTADGLVCGSANHAVRFLSSGEAPDASSDGGQSASTDGMNMGYERWSQQLEVWPLPPDADAQISKVGGSGRGSAERPEGPVVVLAPMSLPWWECRGVICGDDVAGEERAGPGGQDAEGGARGHQGGGGRDRQAS